MPALNDLTPEEEAEFAQHGVTSAGPGGEPIIEGQKEGEPQLGEGQSGPDLEGQQGQESQQGQQPVQISRHREDGTFKTKEEYDAEVAAAEAAQQGQQGQGQGGQQAPQGFVPHAALHESRQREAQARQQLATMSARMNALLMSQQQQPGAEQVQMPDIAQDPAGFLIALEKRLTQFEQGQQQFNEERRIDSALNEDEALFTASVPDYQDASDYYVASRARELLQFHPPQQAQEIMLREARMIAQQAWQRGQSAAQTVYGLAQARGYAPQNTSRDPMRFPVQGESQGQHQQAQLQPGQQQVPGGPTAQSQITAIRQGQQASKSLSGGGAGGRGVQQLNAEAVLNMSDEEFDRHFGFGTKGANERFAQLG